jgi:hypothetical protein
MSCDEQPNDDGVVSASSSTEFGSPLQVTPLFRSLAAGIPSPKFSESVSYSKTLILQRKLLEFSSMVFYSNNSKEVSVIQLVIVVGLQRL